MTPASNPNALEKHKAALHGMLACLSAGDVDGFIHGLGPGYVRHCQAMPPELQEIQGAEVMRQWPLENKPTFPDYREQIEMLVGEGEFLAWRSIGTGTQTGAMGPFPATGKRMRVVIIGMHRFEKGKIVETWTSWDNLSVLVQLGLAGSAGL